MSSGDAQIFAQEVSAESLSFLADRGSFINIFSQSPFSLVGGNGGTRIGPVNLERVLEEYYNPSYNQSIFPQDSHADEIENIVSTTIDHAYISSLSVSGFQQLLGQRLMSYLDSVWTDDTPHVRQYTFEANTNELVVFSCPTYACTQTLTVDA